MSRLLAAWRTWLLARRDARAYAEVREIVDTDEWLITLAGARSPRPFSDDFLPASPAKDGS